MSSCAWGKGKEGGEIIKEGKGKGFACVMWGLVIWFSGAF